MRLAWQSQTDWDQLHQDEGKRNRKQKECVQMLIEAGANVNAQTYSGISALINSSVSGYNVCTDLLLEAGADVNATSKEGYTLLMYLAMFGRETCLNALLAAGANANIKNNSGSTALIIASLYGHDNCVKSLVEAGAYVKVRDNQGSTALLEAAFFTSFKCVENLLNAGANVNGTAKDGRTPLLRACMHVEDFCSDFIRNSRNTYISANHGVLRTIEILLRASAEVNITDDAGHVPLIAVLRSNHDECTPLLLESGVDVNTVDSESGSSALMVAIGLLLAKRETIDQLLTAGADVDIMNNKGETAFTVATVHSNVALAKRLLMANCHISNKARAGMVRSARMYPLKLHLKSGQPVKKNIIRLLFAAGVILDNDNVLKKRLQDVLQLTDVKMHLKHICREATRKHLLKLDPHQHLFSRIPKLGLPEIINQYLLYDESLKENESDQ